MATGLDLAIRRLLPMAEELFDEINGRTRVDGATRRAPYGPGEQAAGS